MILNKRIDAFANLGLSLSEMLTSSNCDNDLKKCMQQAHQKNAWFISDFVTYSLENIAKQLDKKTLEAWTSKYEFASKSKTVGLVAAGNIPLVSFHDFLAVLISGHKVLLKLSSKDNVLMPFLIKKLIETEPTFSEKIIVTDGILKDFDAVIATGSNNSAHYFEYYFKQVKHIIRKNRSSIAILDGTETTNELDGLINDALMYFGLGCRNVSKIFIPVHFDIRNLYKHISKFVHIKDHYKYFNNYEYNRAIYLVNKTEHFDNDYLIFKEDEGFFSPLSVLYYEKYDNLCVLQEKIANAKESIQCIVSKSDVFYKKSTGFGNAQNPEINDYADDIDTLKFLEKL
ncbi:MAG: acyl-CoA reductase [Bacteroidales bacterium]|nr:acyl-CoA reductase [Bacteroidales bacterium]